MVLDIDVGLIPGDFVLNGDPAPLPKKGAEPPPQIFGSCLLWPNGWMHQYATWFGGRPQPRGLCVRWGPSPGPLPKRGRSPQFSAHVYCGQTVRWIKMALGMEVGVGPGLTVLDGDPAPLPKKGTEPPISGPSLLWPNVWMHQDGTWYGGGPQPRRLCVRLVWGPSPYHKRDGAPQFSAHVYCGQTAAWIKMPLGTEVGLACLRDTVFDVDPATPRKKGTPTPTQFSAHIYCGQMAGWMKMPLGTEVDLGPGHTVLDGVPAPVKGAQQRPSFQPMSIVATVDHLSYC